MRIIGQSIVPTVIDSHPAFDLHLVADGAGNVVAGLDDVQPCQDPSGNAYQCSQLHLLRFTPASGVQQVIATVGGTWGTSTRTWLSSGLQVATGSVTTGQTSTSNYFCGINCGVAGETEALDIFSANVSYQIRCDPTCTPGALNPVVTQATIEKTICVSGWTETVRRSESVTEREKLASIAAYGDSGSLHDYEYDHLVWAWLFQDE